MPETTGPVSRCPHCTEPVIVRADGKVLEVEPHRFGINRPDEGTLLPSQVARAFHGKEAPTGHVAHRCSKAEQQALFDLIMPTSERRPGR